MGKYTLLKNNFKEHFYIMIFIERNPLKRCQGCVKLIASKVNCFLNINDLNEVQLCMSSNSWTWECPHTKDGADHVPLILLSSVYSFSSKMCITWKTIWRTRIIANKFNILNLIKLIWLYMGYGWHVILISSCSVQNYELH